MEIKNIKPNLLVKKIIVLLIMPAVFAAIQTFLIYVLDIRIEGSPYAQFIYKFSLVMSGGIIGSIVAYKEL